MKELRIIIKGTCEECPYCQFNCDCVPEGYECNHLNIEGNIFITPVLSPFPEILKNCPLPDAEGGLGC